MLASADELAPRPHTWSAATQLQHHEGLLERWDARRSWGSPLVVQTLEAVSERLAWELPHADPLLVGDLSRRGGGPLEGHKTHDLGVDADIGLYMRGGRQPLGGFLELKPRELDCEATWAIIRALLDTGNVQFILLDQDHIEVLRSYVRHEVGLDEATIDAVFSEPGERPDWRERETWACGPGPMLDAVAAHFEAEALLRFQNRAGAKGVAAMERARMVEDVQNAGHGARLIAGVLNAASTALG